MTRLDSDTAMPDWLPVAGFTALVRTPRELSVVCREDSVPTHLRSERGWRCVGVLGTLDFSLVGILSGLTSILAAEGISVFAVSTFDTDYFLVRGFDLDRALSALESAGHRVLKSSEDPPCRSLS